MNEFYFVVDTEKGLGVVQIDETHRAVDAFVIKQKLKTISENFDRLFDKHKTGDVDHLYISRNNLKQIFDKLIIMVDSLPTYDDKSN